MKYFLLIVFLFLSELAVAQTPTPDQGTQGTKNTEELLALAQIQRGPRVQFANEQGAKTIPTNDGKSFFVFWTPPGKNAADLPTIVTLSGHDGWAYEDFYVWHPFVKEHGYNILALQWWFGGGETMDDYYRPRQMYFLIADFLKQNQLTKNKIMLHGFSRGSANIYAVAALDTFTNNHLFSLIVANAGGASMDYPPTNDVNTGRMGPKPFTNTRWVLFCGGQDPNPDKSGCPAMQRTQKWIESLGGKIVLFLEDKTANHGGFHRHPENTEAALKKF